MFRVLRDQIVVAVAQARVQIMPEHDVVERDHLWGVHIAIVARRVGSGKFMKFT